MTVKDVLDIFANHNIRCSERAGGTVIWYADDTNNFLECPLQIATGRELDYETVAQNSGLSQYETGAVMEWADRGCWPIPETNPFDVTP